MIIDKAEVIVTSPDRNFVTLKLTTDDGLTGLGDATLNGRELAVVAYLRDHVVPLLIGRTPRIEDTWQFLYRSAYWRRGPVTMAAIAAVDMALWDIKGKAAGMPVYQLLGGASRTGLLAYGHASGKELPELFDSRARAPGAGLPGDPHPDRCARPEGDLRDRLAGGRYEGGEASATTTSRRGAARSRSRRTGTRASYLRHLPVCSRRSATSSGPRSRCCTTATTG